MAAQTANVVTLISTETLANSLGGTIVSNTAQVTNLTANGTTIEWIMCGQSLPINFGSETFYPPVSISVYAGANGNATDTLVYTGVAQPAQDQGGSFVVNGLLVYKANAKTAVNAIGGGVNTGWGGMMQVPTTALGGGVKTVLNIVAFTGSNGNANVVTASSGNTANVTFIVQPQTGQNTNTSVTSLVAWTCNGAGAAVI